MPRGRVVAIVGAESTGKTTLAFDLAQRLDNERLRVAVVTEYLREFCDDHRRTPFAHEQPGIATEQTRRIDAAAALNDVVVADTTALMTAVYSDYVFGDRSLYALAAAAHAQVDLVLLTALDVPWQPDGLQRDGPQVRAPVDALVRDALVQTAVRFVVVDGGPRARLEQALQAVHDMLDMRRIGV